MKALRRQCREKTARLEVQDVSGAVFEKMKAASLSAIFAYCPFFGADCKERGWLMEIQGKTVFRFLLVLVIFILPKIVRADGPGWGAGPGVDLCRFDRQASSSGQSFLGERGL